MEDKELLAAIEAMLEKKLDEKLEPVVERLGKLEEGQGGILERLDAIEEGIDELRSGVNTLLEWSEGVGTKFDMPLRPAQ